MSAFFVALVVAGVLTALLVAMAMKLSAVTAEAERLSSIYSAAGVLKSGFAYSVSHVTSTVTIMNKDGDAKVDRVFTGVRPNEGFAVSRIGGRFVGSGLVRVAPELGPLENWSGKHDFSRSGENTSVAQYELQFCPALEHTDRINFSVTMEYSRLHEMTRAAVAKAYRGDAFRNEYHSVRADIPIDSLTLEVVFPDAFEFSAHGTAFYGDSEVVVKAEAARVDKLLEVDKPSRTVKLSVPDPKFTVQYAIYWVPKR